MKQFPFFKPCVIVLFFIVLSSFQAADNSNYCLTDIGKHSQLCDNVPYIPSLQEMEKLALLNENDFETYILKKGFSPDYNLSKGINKQYECDVQNADGSKNYISRTKSDASKPIITFSTTNKQYYIDFKQTLLTKGYLYFKSDTKKDENGNITTTLYYFTKKPFNVYLFSLTPSNGSVLYYANIYEFESSDQ